MAAEWLGFYDKLLRKAGSVYSDGEGLSVADLTVHCMMSLLNMIKSDTSSLPEEQPFPSAMLDEVAANPKVIEWNTKAKL